MLQKLLAKISKPKIIAPPKNLRLFKPGYEDCFFMCNDYISVITDIPSNGKDSGKGKAHVVILDPEHKIRYSQAILSLAIFPPLERKGTIAKLYREYGYVVCDVRLYDRKQVEKVISLLDKIYNSPEYTPKNKYSWVSGYMKAYSKTYNPEDKIFTDRKGEIMKHKNELAERGYTILSGAVTNAQNTR